MISAMNSDIEAIRTRNAARLVTDPKDSAALDVQTLLDAIDRQNKHIEVMRQYHETSVQAWANFAASKMRS